MSLLSTMPKIFSQVNDTQNSKLIMLGEI